MESVRWKDEGTKYDKRRLAELWELRRQFIVGYSYSHILMGETSAVSIYTARTGSCAIMVSISRSAKRSDRPDPLLAARALDDRSGGGPYGFFEQRTTRNSPPWPISMDHLSMLSGA